MDKIPLENLNVDHLNHKGFELRKKKTRLT